MKRILIGVCVALLLAGCGSTGGQKPKASVDQRDVTSQSQADAAAKAAAAKAATDQAALKRQQEEEARRRAEEERKRAEAEAARKAGEPVVKPLPQEKVSAKPLTDTASMLNDPASPLSKRSVYYDFDMYAISAEFQPMVEAHAKFLAEHKDLKIRVEGNCDERGSREYNLALGQRRADAIKRAMTLVGASPKQIETVSFGAEKPKTPGSSEEAWSENRRSDIIYIGVEAQ